MQTKIRSIFAAAVAVLLAGAAMRVTAQNKAVGAQSQTLTYATDGSIIAPKDYREWVFLSSGIDMTYEAPKGAAAGTSYFDNVFVNPASYRSFLANGTWPDKTVMVLEIRAADTHPSLKRGGHSQGELAGMSLHVKDTSRFNGGWAFFAVDDSGKGKLIPRPAECYTCHQQHAAVDTTFAQFYPTLMPIAQQKGTISAEYLKEFPPTAK